MSRRGTSEQRNLEIVKKVFQALNGDDREGEAALLDDECVWDTHGLPAVHGRGALAEARRRCSDAFSELRFEVKQMIASGDRVMVRWLAKGTLRAQTTSRGSVDERLEVHGCSFAELRHGKVIHVWNYWDDERVLRLFG